MRSELEEKLKESANNIRSYSCRLIELIEAGVKDHFRWLMAIDAGSMIWFISSLDRFVIEGELFWKKLYISILVLQALSSVIFFVFNGIMFTVALELRLLNIEMNSSKIDSLGKIDKLKEQHEKLEKRIPSIITAVIAEILFALSFVSFAVYIVFFIVKNR